MESAVVCHAAMQLLSSAWGPRDDLDVEFGNGNYCRCVDILKGISADVRRVEYISGQPSISLRLDNQTTVILLSCFLGVLKYSRMAEGSPKINRTVIYSEPGTTKSEVVDLAIPEPGFGGLLVRL
jgi:hypothetical protein